MKVPANKQKSFFIPTLLALLVILAASTDRLEAQAVFTWTGNGDGVTWNQSTNWSPDTGFPNALTDVGQFGAAVTGNLSLEVNHGSGFITNLSALSSANGNVSINFANAQSQGFRDITIAADSGLNTFTITGTNVRYQNSGTFTIPTGKTVLYSTSQLRHGGGGAQTMTLTGGGTFRADIDLWGVNRQSGGPSPDGVRLDVGNATVSIFEGQGRTVDIMTTSQNVGRSVFWTFGATSTLAMEVGATGDMLRFLEPGDPSLAPPVAVQGNWLVIPDEGATLHVRKAPDFSLNTWYTLFRNVNQPDNDFTNITGLAAGESASFRLFEYNTGLFDYQVMIIPEPGTAGLLLLGGASWLLLRARQRNHR